MKTFIVVLIITVIGGGIYFAVKNLSNKTKVNNEEIIETASTGTSTSTSGITGPESVIGKSVEGRDIIAYHFMSAQTGSTSTNEILFIGGIHGGYEWNTSLVAYELVDYLKANPSVIPGNIKVTVIPVLNPDGLNKVVGSAGRFTTASVPKDINATVTGRFNANNVDLNRNFDCDWKASATWQKKTVSGGNNVFSEPESLAIKNYIENNNPKAVVVWYSSAGGVYASSCHNGVSLETSKLTNTYASASGYPAYENFNFYEITGDMVNWLAKKNIPAISVLLTNHTDTEWSKNQKGIEAILKYYTK